MRVRPTSNKELLEKEHYLLKLQKKTDFEMSVYFAISIKCSQK